MKQVKTIRYYPTIKTKFKDWESVFGNPMPIKIETIKTGMIASKLGGILNLDNHDAIKLKDGVVKMPVLAHLIRHEKSGDYLIDIGFDSSFSKCIGGNFKVYLKDYTLKIVIFRVEFLRVLRCSSMGNV